MDEGRAHQGLRLAGDADGRALGRRADGSGHHLRLRLRSVDRAQALRPPGVLRRGRDRQGRARLAGRLRLEGGGGNVRDPQRREGPLARGGEEAGGREVVATASKAGTTPLAGVLAAGAEAPALPRPAGWRRPALRVLSIGLFFAAWHVATTWDLDFYVRFQNIPGPEQVLEEAVALFSSSSFYVHILASLERIWLGFAIARRSASDSGCSSGGSPSPRTYCFRPS